MSLKKVSAYLKICVVLIVVIDLWIVAFPLIQTKPIAEIYDSNAVIDYLSTDTSLFRVLDLAGVLPRYKQYDKPYAVIDIGSGKFDGLNASVSLINKAFDYKTLTIEDRKLLDVLNVKYILSPSLLNDSSLEFVQSFDHIFVYVWGADNTYETIYLYKNPSVLPRIYFLPDTQLGIEEVNINYSPNRISTEFTAPVNGYLVVLDAYYPSWKASVNNKPVQILRYQEYFRQIPLSAGENHIELMFVPPFGRYARWISIISIFILINMLVIFRKNIFK